MTQRSRATAPVRRGKRRNWLSSQLSRRPLPLWAVITADVLVFAVALITYALFHHVLPRKEVSAGVVSQRVASAATAAPTQAPVEAAPAFADEAVGTLEAAPQATDPVGVFALKFADKFTDGEVISDSTGYRSAGLNISFQTLSEPELVYYVADIYIKDIECFRTVLAKDDFGRGRYEWVADMSARLGGVLAVNGDYYGGRGDGIVIRNGELYRKKRPLRDVCVINWDGTMEIYTPETWDTQAAMDNGAYQGWNFGPNLLNEDGSAREYFDSEVAGNNPRTAIGYFEPGHYCLVVVDGRSKKSKGATLQKLSEIMAGLGCAKAYNLDGGQTSCMVVGDKVISKPYKGGRKCSDAVVIVDR